MARQALSTTVVGSYPQPDWLVDRTLLSKGVPRVRLRSIWRVPEEILEPAQDDATVVAIRDMERASIDVISDGEIRRESYSNRFATALEGVDVDQPAVITDRYSNQTQVPRVVGPIRRTRPVELRDMQFLRRNTDRPAKITLPGPFTMAQQARNEHYRDVEELAMACAEAVNAEARDLQAAGADAERPRGGQALRGARDQSRARRPHRADRGAPLLRLRGGGEASEAHRLFVPAPARGARDARRGRSSKPARRMARDKTCWPPVAATTLWS